MPRDKSGEMPLGLTELLAIAIGGMIGGGIFTVLGIAVALVGAWAPVAIALGGAVAALAAYSYVQLGKLFMDEGATYAFFRLSFPGRERAAGAVGWWTVFGYISTLALYAYTFSSYALSPTGWADAELARKAVALAVIWVFALINIWSVKGMGQIEDVMVYLKVAILVVISGFLWANADAGPAQLIAESPELSLSGLVTVAAVTFVAYEGFQLVINAVREMRDPVRNMPRAIYGAVAIVALIYFVVAAGAVSAIPFADIIAKQEYALAAGAQDVLGSWGARAVVLGAVLATMSAISGTLFGASRQMARIADDGLFPATLGRRSGAVPVHAILAMAATASGLILIGNLRMILEFGSVTFLVVSFLMAYANHKHRAKTGSHVIMTLGSMAGLALGTVVIFWHEYQTDPAQMAFILGLYVVLTLGALGWSARAGSRA
ncbi:MAG: APC family permease [Brevirhabdus sp.]